MKAKRAVFLLLGFLSLALGAVGTVLPVLPSVPFFLLTVYCFARSSQRLHDWFIGTQLYRKHLESYVKKKGMRLSTKLGIMATVTLMMGAGFVVMLLKGLLVSSALLGVVWLGHIIYFIFGVRRSGNDRNLLEGDGAIEKWAVGRRIGTPA